MRDSEVTRPTKGARGMLELWRSKAVALGGAGLVALAIGCADPATTVQPSPPSTRPSVSILQSLLQPRLDTLAKAIATTAEDRGVRTSLRDAWRSSLLSEHRIVLQEFLQSPGGGALRTALANALKVTPEALDASLAGMPKLDLFVPFSAHRKTWQGTPGLVVGGMVDRHHTAILRAYGVRGTRVDLRRADGTPRAPLAILVPSESVARRANPQPAVAGALIEEAGDGTEAGIVTITDKSGTVTEYQIADLRTFQQTPTGDVKPMADCGDDCGTGPGGGGGQINPPPTAQDTVYVRAFVIFWQDQEWGGHEVQMNADLYYTIASTTPDQHSHYRRDGIEACNRATPPSSASCVAWQSQEPGVYLFLIPAGFGFAKIDMNTYEMNVVSNDWHGFTQYTSQTVGTWRPMCAYTCPPEDGDIYLKRTYH